MQQYLVDVQLGGKQAHVQSKKTVTIPEIAVLRAVHGPSSVTVVGKASEPAQTRTPDDRRIPRTVTEERERLRRHYQGTDVDTIFGGPLAPLPTTLRQIGVDPGAEAARLREQAAQHALAASALEEEDAGAPDEAAAEASIFDDED